MLVDFWSMTKAGQRYIATTAFDFFHVNVGSHNDLFIVTPLSLSLSLFLKGYFLCSFLPVILRMNKYNFFHSVSSEIGAVT